MTQRGLDPDKRPCFQLVLGDYGLSRDQERVQFAMWCLFASQLLMSVDVRSIRNESRDILLNLRAIAVSQDPLGIQGHRALQVSTHQVYRRTEPCRSAPISSLIDRIVGRNLVMSGPKKFPLLK